MNFSALSIEVGLPRKALVKLYQHGLITDPLGGNDIKNMKFLAKIWGKTEFIQLQISKLSKSDRARLVLRTDLNKIESRIQSRYINHRLSQRGRKRSKPLSIRQVVDECLHYFDLDEDKRGMITQTAYKIRKHVDYLLTKDSLAEHVTVDREAARNNNREAKKADHRNKEKNANESRGEYAPIFG